MLSRVREIRNGDLNDTRFGTRMRGEGAYAEQLHSMFDLARRRVGLDAELPVPRTENFLRPTPGQYELFDLA